MVWAGIKNWVTGENLTSVNFNEQIQSNMAHLLNGNIRTVEIRNGVSDPIGFLASGWQPIDPLVQFVTINTSGGHILLKAGLSYYNTGTAGATNIDVKVIPKRGTPFFISSYAETPTALWREQAGTNYTRTRSLVFLWENVPAGEYRLQLWWSAAVGNNLLNYTNTTMQFTAQEWGA